MLLTQTRGIILFQSIHLKRNMTEASYSLGVKLAENTAELVKATEDATILLLSATAVHKRNNAAISLGFYTTLANYLCANASPP